MSFDKNTKDRRATRDDEKTALWDSTESTNNDGQRDGSTVTKLVGGPGTGKTTRLLEYIETEASNGTKLTDLQVSTFTRAGQAEMLEHIKDVYPSCNSDDYRDAARTVHGVALKCCFDADLFELRNTNPDATGLWLLIDDEESHATRRAFFDRRFPAYEYDPTADNPLSRTGDGIGLDSTRTETPVGNQLFAINELVTSTGRDPERYWDGRGPDEILGVPDHEVIEMLHEWQAFKSDHDLIEHADYVARAVEHGLVPDASVVVIDEFQDLDPMQHRLYECWRDSGHVDHIYIGGDANQSIYGFRGVDPSYFPTTRADEHDRQQTSYRCPTTILETAVRVLGDAAPGGQPTLDAHHDGGRVEHVRITDRGHLARLVSERLNESSSTDVDAAPGENTVFVLSRTNNQTQRVTRRLRDEGVPYFGLDPDGRLTAWSDPRGAILEALRCLADGRHPPIANVEYLLNYTAPIDNDAQADFRDAMDKGRVALAKTDAFEDGVDIPRLHHDELRAMFPLADYRDPRAIIPLLTLDDWGRQILRAALVSDATHLPRAVRVGTIHAAKGLETDHVILSADYTHRQHDRFKHDPETRAEEQRLYYVALTRVRQSVTIVHDLHPATETVPPLERRR